MHFLAPSPFPPPPHPSLSTDGIIRFVVGNNAPFEQKLEKLPGYTIGTAMRLSITLPSVPNVPHGTFFPFGAANPAPLALKVELQAPLTGPELTTCYHTVASLESGALCAYIGPDLVYADGSQPGPHVTPGNGGGE